ncbi:MAG: hypothetical protein J5965_17170 [Aeriscardovia sp.]|nr:hypothetical protein [Aeriscardovia sp.]
MTEQTNDARVESKFDCTTPSNEEERLSEFEKMRREEFYDFTSEECLASYYRAKHVCAKLQTMTTVGFLILPFT